MARLILTSLLLQASCLVYAAAQYLDWATSGASGVNLGGWLVQESTIDTDWWGQYSKGAQDEWGLCANQGSLCGSILEQRYATWITTADIDGLYDAGVNTLLHSLPGGVNGMAFGEAEVHYGWFKNQTVLDYSLKAIDDPVDHTDPSAFGTPLALSDDGATWVLKYIEAVISRVTAVNPRIPVMFQGSFRGKAYWSSLLPTSVNVVFDVHNYYFAQESAGDGEFPVFIGEWSFQAGFENTLVGRERALNTELSAFGALTQGSSYWTAKIFGNTTVDGEGVQADYWNYLAFAREMFPL
ncbi:glycoside hydrolase superfamily [Aspergillus lucknowensis]|uniref:glucan 1,3-beta-glucosidase n=1 Tax=Aspergillus lucknowensis TaxID=176173 RepID=A0ABR4LP04_9EURO